MAFLRSRPFPRLHLVFVISWPLSGHFFLGLRQKDTEPFIGRTARHPGAIVTEADRDDPAAMLVLGHLRVIFV